MFVFVNISHSLKIYFVNCLKTIKLNCLKISGFLHISIGICILILRKTISISVSTEYKTCVTEL